MWRDAASQTFSIAESLVPKMLNGTRWVPELEADALLLQRVFLAEKWLVARLHYGHVDPREAGVGNIVNCGAAMYVAPVGIANAGDPAGAYAEAIELAGAHQSSYGREAAGVFAAAVAAAMTPGATAASAVGAALALAKDGTRRAVEAVVEAADGVTDWQEAIPVLRKAIEPYDTVGPNYRELSMDARRPSRTKAIEELPVALGFVLVAEGDVRRAVLGGTNYGRDADSIASMAGAITGALQGHDGVPPDWAERIAEASKTDLVEPGRVMASVVRDIRAADAERWARRAAALDALV